MVDEAAGLRSKRAPPDPRGPVLELLQAFGVRERNGYYDGKVRGKVLRLDNLRQLSATLPSGGKGSGRGRALSGYGGGRHRRAAAKAAVHAEQVESDQKHKATSSASAPVSDAADSMDGELHAPEEKTDLGTLRERDRRTDGAKGKRVNQWAGLRYQDFEPLRELWVAYFDELRPGPGPALAEVLASADLHGSTLVVVQAKNPGCLRLRGTVLEETQRTFRIVTPDDRVRVLPKESCVFEVEARGERVAMLGPAWAHRLPGGVPGPLAPQVWSLARQRLGGSKG